MTALRGALKPNPPTVGDSATADAMIRMFYVDDGAATLSLFHSRRDQIKSQRQASHLAVVSKWKVHMAGSDTTADCTSFSNRG
jgi:hypothetical protein